MEDSGGSGGSPGGTYWYGIDVQVMWNWVNRDLSPHYDQASSWKKASELAGLYAQRLQAFRDRLAQTWNPETSKASEAYLTKLDELIGSVKNIDTVAGANYQAAVDIPNAIAEAKYKLQPIYHAWQAAETPEQATLKANEAAGVMYTLSSDLSGSRTALGPPQPYVPPGRAGSGRDEGGYDGGSSATPPMIPPVVPMPPPTPPPSLPPGPVQPFPIPKGPDLVGLNPPLVPTPPTPPTPPPPPNLPPGNPGPLPPPNVIKPPLPGNPGPLPPGTKPPLPPGRPPITGMPPVMTPPGGAPPGRGTTGLIGGTPPPPTTAGRTQAGGARPNPVGGMIGGATGGGRPGMSGAMGVGGAGVAGRGPGAGGAAGRGAMGAMGVGGRPGQVHDEEGEHFDPDTQWDVAQGVAPVLDAPEERQDYIDPGPAIGLAR